MFKQNSLVSNIFDILVLITVSFFYVVFENINITYAYLSVISIVIKLLLPVLLVMLTYRNNVKSITSNVVAVLFTIAISNTLVFSAKITDTLILFLSVCLLPISIGFAFKKSYNYLKTLLVGTFANTAYYIVYLLKIILIDKINITEDIIKPMLTVQYNDLKAIMPDLSVSFTDLVNYITLNAPCVFIIISMFIALFYIALSKKVIEVIYKQKIIGVGSFSEICLNRSVSFAFLIFMLISIFSSSGSVFIDAISNVIAIMLAVFFINGLSFIDYHFRKTGLWTIVRVIIYIAAISLLSLFFIFSPVLIIAVIGMSDCNADYRRIRTDTNAQK